MTSRYITALFCAVVLAAGCGASQQAADGPAPTDATETEEEETAPVAEADAWSAELETRTGSAQPLVPVGYGTLSQDDITVPLRAGDLQIKFVPLSEWILRLTAPDTYRRLNGYKVSRSNEILHLTERAGGRNWPFVAFVTFFSRSVEESFEPYDLRIENQGRLYRPFEIVPVTPGFGRDRLGQQESQIALYLFDPGIDLGLPTTVRYRDAESTRWSGIRSTLDSERSRATSRAGAGAG
ncbi:MAG: hypothetical protein ACODAA_01975 [Gemmatimonadota bacterium]